MESRFACPFIYLESRKPMEWAVVAAENHNWGRGRCDVISGSGGGACTGFCSISVHATGSMLPTIEFGYPKVNYGLCFDTC